MKNLEDEKLGMNNLTMQYIFFLIQTLWLRFKVLILQRQHSHIPLYVCWLCYVPISIFLSFTPVLSINTNASRTLKFLRFCTQNTRETFKSASLYDPKVYKQEDPQKVTFVLHIWLRNHFSMYLNLLLYVFLVQPFIQKIENVLRFSKNSKKTESESIQSILVSTEI